MFSISLTWLFPDVRQVEVRAFISTLWRSQQTASRAKAYRWLLLPPSFLTRCLTSREKAELCQWVVERGTKRTVSCDAGWFCGCACFVSAEGLLEGFPRFKANDLTPIWWGEGPSKLRIFRALVISMQMHLFCYPWRLYITSILPFSCAIFNLVVFCM